MRTTEVFEVECLCGRQISSPKKEFKCPDCHREGRIEMTPDVAQAASDKITEIRRAS